MIKAIPIFFSLLLAPNFWAQTATEKILEGKIFNETAPVEKINVFNATNGKATVSDVSGFFRIPVKLGDALVFSAVNLETRRIIIDQDLLSKELLLVKMNTAMTPLEEVRINENSHINAENLGIIPRGQKKYTPAERRMNEATTGGGIVPLNPILNAISGRTKMLKKEISIEKKERLLQQLDGWFEQDYYVSTLKIPTDYIKGFHYFLIEDTSFARALKAKNKTLTKFLAQALALEYNDTLTAQKK